MSATAHSLGTQGGRLEQAARRLRQCLEVVLIGWQLFLRDFRTRYRRTYLGYFWAFARVLATGVPIILVGKQFELGPRDLAVPYEVYAFIGILLWQTFWDAMIFPQWIGRRVRKLVRDNSIPYFSIPIAGCFYSLFHVLLYSVLGLAAFLVFRTAAPASATWMLLVVPSLIMAGLSIGIFFLPITLVYMDVRYSLPFMSSILLWTAPIFYERPEGGVLRLINDWNPLTYLIGIPRQMLTTGTTGADEILFFLMLIPFVVLLVAGAKFLYKGMAIAVERII